MKRFTAVILSLIMCFCFSFSSFADNGASLSFEGEPTEGERIKITISYDGEKNFNAASFTFYYDSTKMVLMGSTFSGCNDDRKGTIKVIESLNSQGFSCTLTFALTSGGKAKLKVTDILVSDGYSEDELPDINYSMVIKYEVSGDVNGDGSFDIGDLAALKLYLADGKKQINSENSDLDKSGKVDIADLAKMKIRLAGE